MCGCYFTGRVIFFEPDVGAFSCLTYRHNTGLETKNMELEGAFVTVNFNVSFSHLLVSFFYDFGF